jgi:hypothetical protein
MLAVACACATSGCSPSYGYGAYSQGLLGHESRTTREASGTFHRLSVRTPGVITTLMNTGSGVLVGPEDDDDLILTYTDLSAIGTITDEFTYQWSADGQDYGQLVYSPSIPLGEGPIAIRIDTGGAWSELGGYVIAQVGPSVNLASRGGVLSLRASAQIDPIAPLAGLIDGRFLFGTRASVGATFRPVPFLGLTASAEHMFVSNYYDEVTGYAQAFVGVEFVPNFDE